MAGKLRRLIGKARSSIGNHTPPSAECVRSFIGICNQNIKPYKIINMDYKEYSFRYPAEYAEGDIFDNVSMVITICDENGTEKTIQMNASDILIRDIYEGDFVILNDDGTLSKYQSERMQYDGDR